ncbi:MAG: HU family DNA-binding protein [Brevinemataceae bacterium]
MGKSKLTKSDLVDLLCNEKEIIDLSVNKQKISIIVSLFIKILRNQIQGLNEKERIELRGFGTFGVRYRKERIARNPKTNENVHVPSRKLPYFKIGRHLRSVNNIQNNLN